MKHLLSIIYYPLSIICCGRPRDRSHGFTMVEMVAVILILSLLMSVLVTGLTHARKAAWRIQARETCRELCEAWNAYLLDERAFPKESEFQSDGGGIPATAENLEFLTGKRSDVTSKVYLELSDDERDSSKLDGLCDHWKNKINFMLDFDYKGELDNPHPAANGLGNNAKVRTSVMAWVPGSDTREGTRMPREDRWIVVW